MKIMAYLCAAALVGSAGLLRGGDETRVRMELFDSLTRGRPRCFADEPGHPLRDVRAFVDVDSVQHNVAKGLQILVDLVSESDKPAVLGHLPESPESEYFVRLRLYNAAGVEVTSPGSVVIERSGDPRESPEARALEACRKRGFVRCNRIEHRSWIVHEIPVEDRGPGVKSLRDVGYGERGSSVESTLTLLPGERFQFIVQVTEILGEAEAYWAAQKEYEAKVKEWREDQSNPHPGLVHPKIIPITPGVYALEVVFPMGPPGRQEPGCFASSDRIKVELREK